MLDQAEQKGTGRWTVQNALDLGVPITGISEATMARGAVRIGSAAGGGAGQAPRRDRGLEDRRSRSSSWKTCGRRSTPPRWWPTRRVLTRSRRRAPSTTGTSTAVPWHRIWRGGCIIRARFLNRITEAYERNPDLPLLLADDYFTEAVGNSLAAWRRVVAGAAQNGIPTPAFSSSLAYYDGIRAERLPAALIQAQRDFFGAHTYHRVDKDGSFHTEWSADRTERQVGEAFKQEVPEAKEAEKAPATSA